MAEGEAELGRRQPRPRNSSSVRGGTCLSSLRELLIPRAWNCSEAVVRQPEKTPAAHVGLAGSGTQTDRQIDKKGLSRFMRLLMRDLTPLQHRVQEAGQSPNLPFMVSGLTEKAH